MANANVTRKKKAVAPLSAMEQGAAAYIEMRREIEAARNRSITLPPDQRLGPINEEGELDSGERYDYAKVDRMMAGYLQAYLRADFHNLPDAGRGFFQAMVNASLSEHGPIADLAEWIPLTPVNLLTDWGYRPANVNVDFHLIAWPANVNVNLLTDLDFRPANVNVAPPSKIAAQPPEAELQDSDEEVSEDDTERLHLAIVALSELESMIEFLAKSNEDNGEGLVDARRGMLLRMRQVLSVVISAVSGDDLRQTENMREVIYGPERYGLKARHLSE
jgi:hypothetical protein